MPNQARSGTHERARCTCNRLGRPRRRDGRPRGGFDLRVRRQREHVGRDDPAADDEQGHRHAGGRAAVGGHGLLARRRGGDRDLRRARRRVRPAPHVPRRPAAVRRLLRLHRALFGRRRHHRGPHDPGRLGSDDPRLRHEPLVGRCVRRGADARDHDLGRGLGGRRRRGAARRRRPRRAQRLAGPVLDRRRRSPPAASR